MWRALRGIFRRDSTPAWYESEIGGAPCWVTTVEHKCGHHETYSTAVEQDSDLAKRELVRLRRQQCFKCRGAADVTRSEELGDGVAW